MKSQKTYRTWLLFFTVVFAGVVLRLVWVKDMEWKYDEIWMYNAAMLASRDGVWQTVGMRSGVGIVNPGLGVWTFSLIGFFVDTPMAMVRFVQASNVIAIFGFLVFAAVCLPAPQRLQWYWGIALASVNPLYILFSRKIWAQDLLPFFCLPFIVGHFHREKKWGAFLWGLSGSLLGQIHMSGFFYALGFFLLSFFFDYRKNRKWRWQYWLVGSLVGSIGLVPWVLVLLDSPSTHSFHWQNVVSFKFYLYTLIDPLGLNTAYSLGNHSWQFIRGPVIFGFPTYGVAIAKVLLIGVGLLLLYKLFGILISKIRLIKNRQLIQNTLDRCDYTEFCLLAVLLGLGILMTLSGVKIYSHYLIVAFPFLFIFIARILLPMRRVLFLTVATQLIISICFFSYIHTHGGAEGGDYGKTYRLQTTGE